MTAETVTIPSRFNGPPGSANGGYACGVTARLLAAAVGTNAPIEVTLRRPPPVDRPLRVERGAERVTTFDGDQLVTEAVHGAAPDDDLPEPVTPDRARAAAQSFDVVTYTETHPFPGCFTCGPARREDDGLRIFPAPAPSGESRPMVVWPWTPDPSLAAKDGSGLVDWPVVWAALDCPSGLARFVEGAEAEPASVLGRMTTAVYRRPAIGEVAVASGWALSGVGRTLLSGSALWSASGDVLAASRTVWIVLNEEQRAAFNVASG